MIFFQFTAVFLTCHSLYFYFAINKKEKRANSYLILEVAAQTLGVPVSEIGAISLQSKNKVAISSTCTVFAQTEIVSLIARQTNKEDIAAGLHESIVSRVYGLISSVVANGKRSSDNYKAMLEANKHDPVPATFFDIMGHNFPNLALRYLPETAEHYRLMTEELNQRIADGIVPMTNMKYRVYWDGIPYWFAIRELSEKLESLGLCLVTSGYFDLFSFDRLDPARPLDSVAEGVATMILNHNVSYKAEITEKIFRDYNLEAGIFAYAQSCKPFSITMRYIAEHVQNKLDVPVTIIEGDLVDETFYDGERNNMKLQALAETLAARKG